MEDRLAQAHKVKTAYEADLLRRPHVVGVGIGSRSGLPGEPDEPVIVVSVKVGEPGDLARSSAEFPRELEGVPVEVRVIGSLRAIAALAATVRTAHTGTLMRKQNVVGVGIGYKQTAGATTDELSVVVSVERKVPAALLEAQDLVPRLLDGVPTDVVETGRLMALGLGTRDRWRPVIPPGVSLGHHAITAATFGCLVRRGQQTYILSNNHVLADTNRGSAGDPILQPGPADGGRIDDRIGVLSEFVPIDFGSEQADCPAAKLVETAVNWAAAAIGSSHRVLAFRETPGANSVDAAIAAPLAADMVRSEVLYIGAPVGVGEPSLGARVQKTGRTSGHTQGVVMQIDATVRIDYGGPEAIFEGQFLAGGMSSPGDSGSAVLDMSRRAVGLLFAGSEVTTVCNPMTAVLAGLDVELAT